MIFSFNNEPHNVVNVKNYESRRKIENSILLSFNNELHNVVNVKNYESCRTFEN
jgi:hypothetical protein